MLIIFAIFFGEKKLPIIFLKNILTCYQIAMHEQQQKIAKIYQNEEYLEGIYST